MVELAPRETVFASATPQAPVCDGCRAFQISAAVLTDELNHSGPALRLILAYARGLSANGAGAPCDIHGMRTSTPAPRAATRCPAG